MGILSNIQNILFPTSIDQEKKDLQVTSQNVSNYIFPMYLSRIKQDIGTWRAAIVEAERPVYSYPYRVRMQQLFQDTVLNAHVTACMEVRKHMVMQKDYHLVNKDGVVNEEWTKWAKKEWMMDMMSYGLDAIFYGYQLINLMEIENNTPVKYQIIKRHNISPDREVISKMVYVPRGIEFNNPDYVLMDGEKPYDWLFYFDTPTENGVSNCGYGLLYKVAYYEIFLRNLTGFNANYLELYGSPIRVGKTTKTQETEREEFYQSLVEMGNSGAILMDLNDEIQLVETKGGGGGSNSYDNFESRIMESISKVMLGHGSAMKAVSGKLGSNDDIKAALKRIEVSDCKYWAVNCNKTVLPKLRALGIAIPEDLCFEFKNDLEKEEFRIKEDESNKITADIAKTMKEAGLQMDAKYFEERTGIPTTEIEAPVDTTNEDAVANIARLRNLYNEANL